jgi:hypothetical protein
LIEDLLNVPLCSWAKTAGRKEYLLFKQEAGSGLEEIVYD